MTMVVTMVSRMTSRVVKASEFKAKCLKLMDEIAATGDTLTVTKNGRPVVEVRAAERPKKSLYGRNRGRIHIVGDLDDHEIDWEMQG
jgi:prevent-host-death family protein